MSGTILAAGDAGAPVLASVYGDWIAEYFLGTRVYPLPLSLSSGLSWCFPAAVQAYYDTALEPAFMAAAKGLKATSAAAPWPIIALIVLALDILLAAGFAAFCVATHLPLAAALAATAAAARRTKLA